MRLPVFFVIGALLLSGCVTEESDDEARDEGVVPPGPVVLPWDLLDCAYVVWGVPVAGDALEPHLPEGFTLGRSDGPLAPVVGDAFLGFESFVCDSGMGLDGRVEGMTYGSLFTSVEPPEDLAIDGIDQYYYKWDPLVPDEPRRLFLQEAGMMARTGTATIDRPVEGLKRAAYTLEGVGSFSLEAPGTAPTPADGGGPFAEFTPLADGGHAVWRADYTTETRGSGDGVFRVDPGSWAAEVLGVTEGRANFNHGTWSFQNGNLTLPS
ncbi:MAG: hypothetical protein KY455_03090 [Euryarchaeota archaeon]|nr:hypothetical protein [Euryarchaeota archaeon]